MVRLPNNCHQCPFNFWNEESCEYWCSWYNCAVDSYGGDKMRMDNCPLEESDIEEQTQESEK
jgi:hypothetical protein